MIKIENDEIVGWEYVIRGIHNFLDYWEDSDSNFTTDTIIGDNDYGLMRLHSKMKREHLGFLEMLIVYCDITAPLY